MPRHCIIVIGASAGGLTPLKQILAELPPDLAANLFVVMHLGAAPSKLDKALETTSRLPVAWARDEEAIGRGRVLLAPPNRHLLIQRGRVRVLFGARENRVRPAADVLFRSAAVAYGTDVVGVVLSGYQEDGAAGLAMIKRSGGLTVVQEPSTAEAPSMPLAAVHQTGDVDHVVPAGEIAAVLIDAAKAEARTPLEIPEDIQLEAAIAERMMTKNEESPPFGSPTTLICPDCGGVLRQLPEGTTPRYRCHVGHAFTAAGLLDAMDGDVEHALWIAVRTLKERASLLRSLAASSRGPGAAEGYKDRAQEVERQSQVVQSVLGKWAAAHQHETKQDEPVGS